ncbi:probable carboxylesterase 18 [Selaginella moellendorffii]|nr:probable carboxylesterase 18 [Selaginella moellendorffii]|eukprot:XP_002968491.2 probable carboxylesterase 18 [Selaginella moellendorffii]
MAPKVAMEFPDGVFFADRSFARRSMPKSLCVEANPGAHPIASRDVIIDEERGLWARIFLPADQVIHHSRQVPVAFYFHGGGFVCFTADTMEYHVLCELLAKKMGAIVISVNYRLAPENRLPAAYHDGFAALKWLAQEQGGRKDPWLAAHADLSKTLLVGDSSGANLVHHMLPMLAAAEDPAMSDIQVVGTVLIQPFFGGVARVPSETKHRSPTPLISTDMCDRFWELALPIGADRDHPYCRVAAPDHPLPKTLIVAGGEDVLCDRAKEFMETMGGSSKDLELLVIENAAHAFYIALESQETAHFLDKVATFAQGIFA